jgi:uncharacterized membrane protein (UPF0127 family)
MKKITSLTAGLLFFAAVCAQSEIKDGAAVKVLIGKKELNLVAAARPQSHAQGLSGRKKMPKDGMIFIFSRPLPLVFWMKDMNFAIDIIWIKDDEITGFAKNAPPEAGKPDYLLKKYFSPQDADTVIELNDGDVEKFGIKIGDKIKINGRLADPPVMPRRQENLND